MSTAEIIILVLGIALYALVMIDVFMTTLSMHGGGPLTTVVTRFVNMLVSFNIDAARTSKNGEKEHKLSYFARYSHMFLTLSLFGTWFFGLTVAMTLVLSSDPSSVALANASEQGSVWLNRLYFVGASLTTAGFGDFVPQGVKWQIFTVIMAISGLVVSSLGIAYVVNLVSAVVAQRKLSRAISNLGSTPAEILAGQYHNGNFSEFGAVCHALADDLLMHTGRHMAYPMIHYVHAVDNRECLPVAIAALDDAMSILVFNVPKPAQPTFASLLALRRAVTAYLESLDETYLTDLPEEPAWPEINFIAQHWTLIPEQRQLNLDEDERQQLSKRRRLLRAAVQSRGLVWDKMKDYLKAPKEESLDADLLALLAETNSTRKEAEFAAEAEMED